MMKVTYVEDKRDGFSKFQAGCKVGIRNGKLGKWQQNSLQHYIFDLAKTCPRNCTIGIKVTSQYIHFYYNYADAAIARQLATKVLNHIKLN